MLQAQTKAVLLSIATALMTALAASADAAQMTETLWRGLLRGDSLYVRATGMPVTGASRCGAAMGIDPNDTLEVARKYIDFRIENAHGVIRTRELVSGPGFSWCFSRLDATASPWRDGLVVSVTGFGCCCEPVSDCQKYGYVYVPLQGRTAWSDWTDLAWDPSSPTLVEGTTTLDCIEYPMTLEPQLNGRILSFKPMFPPEVREGQLIERVLDELSGNGCNREPDSAKTATIEVFPTPESGASSEWKVNPTDPVDIVSVVVRAERVPGSRLIPRVIRFGIRIRDQHGYVTLASLKAMGYLFSLGVE